MDPNSMFNWETNINDEWKWMMNEKQHENEIERIHTSTETRLERMDVKMNSLTSCFPSHFWTKASGGPLPALRANLLGKPGHPVCPGCWNLATNLIPIGRRFQVNYRWIIVQTQRCWMIVWHMWLCDFFFGAYDICLFWFCDMWRCFVFCLLFWSWNLVMLCFGCFGFDFVGWW